MSYLTKLKGSPAPIPPRPPLKDLGFISLGAFFAACVIGYLAYLTNQPIIMGSFGASIFVFSFSFILGFVVLTNSFVIPSIEGVIGSIYIGFFEMGISLVLWQSALKISTTVSRIASLVFITPFLSLIILYFILGERILLSTVAGILLICGGLILQKYFTNKAINQS